MHIFQYEYISISGKKLPKRNYFCVNAVIFVKK